MFENILKRLGLKYEDLTSAERQTLTSWSESLQNNQLSVEKIREYITAMREAVSKELSETPTNAFTWFLGWKRDFSLKARLQNYILLEIYLSSPEKAKQQIENALTAIAGRKVN